LVVSAQSLLVRLKGAGVRGCWLRSRRGRRRRRWWWWWWRRRSDRHGEVLDAAFEALDPFDQRTRIVVDLRVAEAHDGNLEGDPGV
jgi:predicted dehydrogenase